MSNHDQTAFNETMPKLVKSGEIKYVVARTPFALRYVRQQLTIAWVNRTKEHITRGIDNGEAFVDMLDGRNFGKALISLE